MLDIDKFSAKAETVDVGGEKVEVTGLTFPELQEFMKYAQSNDTQGATDYLVFTVLRKNIPKPKEGEDNPKAMTDDEIRDFMHNKLDGATATDILVKVQELSGLGDKNENQNKNQDKPKN